MARRVELTHEALDRTITVYLSRDRNRGPRVVGRLVEVRHRLTQGIPVIRVKIELLAGNPPVVVTLTRDMWIEWD
jgi:hypothetical protein